MTDNFRTPEEHDTIEDDRAATRDLCRKQAKLMRDWHKWELGQTPVPDRLDHLYTARLLEGAAAWIE